MLTEVDESDYVDDVVMLNGEGYSNGGHNGV